jgi:hypothetical protein
MSKCDPGFCSDDAHKIPIQADWGDCSLDWETNYTKEKFFGRSLAEVEDLFKNAPTSAYGYLENMPDGPFKYYVLAFNNVLLPDKIFDNVQAPDVANCFLSIIEWKLNHSPQAIVPIMKNLLPAAEFVAANQKRLEADEDINGSFSDRVEKIKATYANFR